MRILIAGSRGIPAAYGGFESLAEALAQYFSSSGKRTYVSGFSKDLSEPLLVSKDNLTSIQVPVRVPRNLQNLVGTWKATQALDLQSPFDAVVVLNDVNYFIARKYWRRGIPTILHLDGAEARRSGLPIIGRVAHWFLRLLALSSGIPIVVDSAAIQMSLNKRRSSATVISYAPHMSSPKMPSGVFLPAFSSEFFLVIARFVEENQIEEIIEAYLESGCIENLVIVGSGTGSWKYERKLNKLVHNHKSIYILPKNYIRSEINWMLQNAKAYLHGHSVGGTNPILVDARFHTDLIFAHKNIYNRENCGFKENFWTTRQELVYMLRNCEHFNKVKNIHDTYQFESWDLIAKKYLKLLEIFEHRD